jgi:hypothetical protein
VIVSAPDFVRGPGQDVNVPADSTAGIPLSLSDGTGVRSVDLSFRYDPALLEITSASVPPDAEFANAVHRPVPVPQAPLHIDYYAVLSRLPAPEVDRNQHHENQQRADRESESSAGRGGHFS